VKRLALEGGAVAAELNEAFERGGEGAAALAEAVVAAAEAPSDFKPIYDLDEPVAAKIEAVCRRVYGADGVVFLPAAQQAMERYTQIGFDKLPICMAKTQLSLSHDPTVLNAPTGFTMPVRDIRQYTGAGWLVPLLGDMQTMPGYGVSPAAFNVDIDESGRTVGLF
jgi:formyltetrahydrofolate synthetase